MLDWDKDLFYFINTNLTHPFLDAIMPTLTDLHKIPALGMIGIPIILTFWFFKKRTKMIPVLLGLCVTVGATDLFNYRLLKPTFQRPRPPAVEQAINIRSDRYAGYGFPSNHAANNFAGATFLSLCYPALSPVLFGFAAVVAFSRVYVGVHYPLDVIVGGLIGWIFGLFFFKIFEIILYRRFCGKKL